MSDFGHDYPGAGVQTDVYIYPATSNKLGAISLGAGGNRAFTYDAAGNVTYDNRAAGGYGYAYNAAGRMSEFTLSGVLKASYKYDFAGRQAIRTLSGGITIHSVFDSSGNRIAEYNEATGALIREYVWFNGAPLAVIEGGVTTFIRADHIGRPVFGTNTGGTKVWTASYLPFGGVRTTTGTPITARFPGQWFQSESGLHQNWMRDYDPTTGRYLQADPLGLVDGASIYGYARQSPSMYSDPRGECVGPLIYACAAAAGAAVNVAIGIILDFYIGDGCYTWEELARDAALGAAGGPIGLYGRVGAAGASAATGYADDVARAVAGGAGNGNRAVAMGSGRSPMQVPGPQNIPTTIGGRSYTGHALDQMQGRGFVPSVVEDTVARGVRTQGYDGATIYTTEQARVILNPNGSVKTVMGQ